MKREIKFRGLIKNGTWAYGMPCKSNYGIELVTELYHVDGAEWNEYGEDVNPETVGQFTGLKDKNRKDIYEGDIVQWEDTVDDGYGCGYLTQIQEEVSFGGGAFNPVSSMPSKYFEVIGNIYENPELVKP